MFFLFFFRPHETKVAIAQDFLAIARAMRARAVRARYVRIAQKSLARAIFAQVEKIAVVARATYSAFAHLEFRAFDQNTTRAHQCARGTRVRVIVPMHETISQNYKNVFATSNKK